MYEHTTKANQLPDFLLFPNPDVLKKTTLGVAWCSRHATLECIWYQRYPAWCYPSKIDHSWSFDILAVLSFFCSLLCWFRHLLTCFKHSIYAWELLETTQDRFGAAQKRRLFGPNIQNTGQTKTINSQNCWRTTVELLEKHIKFQ